MHHTAAKCPHLEVCLKLALDEEQPLVLQSDEPLKVLHVREGRRRVLVKGEVMVGHEPRNDTVLPFDCVGVQRGEHLKLLLQGRKLLV